MDTRIKFMTIRDQLFNAGQQAERKAVCTLRDAFDNGIYTESEFSAMLDTLAKKLDNTGLIAKSKEARELLGV